MLRAIVKRMKRTARRLKERSAAVVQDVTFQAFMWSVSTELMATAEAEEAAAQSRLSCEVASAAAAAAAAVPSQCEAGVQVAPAFECVCSSRLAPPAPVSERVQGWRVGGQLAGAAASLSPSPSHCDVGVQVAPVVECMCSSRFALPAPVSERAIVLPHERAQFSTPEPSPRDAGVQVAPVGWPAPRPRYVTTDGTLQPRPSLQPQPIDYGATMITVHNFLVGDIPRALKPVREVPDHYKKVTYKDPWEPTVLMNVDGLIQKITETQSILKKWIAALEDRYKVGDVLDSHEVRKRSAMVVHYVDKIMTYRAQIMA